MQISSHTTTDQLSWPLLIISTSNQSKSNQTLSPTPAMQKCETFFHPSIHPSIQLSTVKMHRTHLQGDRCSLQAAQALSITLFGRGASLHCFQKPLLSTCLLHHQQPMFFVFLSQALTLQAGHHRLVLSSGHVLSQHPWIEPAIVDNEVWHVHANLRIARL
jgi:hypothetical protein